MKLPSTSMESAPLPGHLPLRCLPPARPRAPHAAARASARLLDWASPLAMAPCFVLAMPSLSLLDRKRVASFPTNKIWSRMHRCIRSMAFACCQPPSMPPWRTR